MRTLSNQLRNERVLEDLRLALTDWNMPRSRRLKAAVISSFSGFGLRAMGLAATMVGMLLAGEVIAQPAATNAAPQTPLASSSALTNNDRLPGIQTNKAAAVENSKPQAPATSRPSSAVPPEIDSALRDSQEVMASTNLVSHQQTVDDRAQLARLQQTLEQASRQRRDKDFDLAEKGLVGLLKAEAPREIHRSAMLELALLAQDTRQLPRAQQVYSQFVQQFPDDPSVPEVLLRQGLLYREMGAPVMALSKFYLVMSTALTLKLDRLEYYQRLVLQAQTEIADTYYLEGRFEEAGDFFNRLLRLDNPELNRQQILFKLVRCWSATGHYPETLAQAQAFVERYPKSEQVVEVRFLLADALKHLGRKREAMQEVLALMRDQRAVADKDQENWTYWQQRAGNQIANQFYEEGDYLSALEIYLRLADLNVSSNWRLPAWYQAGLIYEHLKQPQKAAEMYTHILESSKNIEGGAPTAALNTVVEMARWRKERLGWQTKAELANQQFSRATTPATNQKQ